MSTQESPFRILFKLSLNQKRMIVVSMMDVDTMWFNEYITDKEYTGFTQKGFALQKEDAQKFVTTVRDIATKGGNQQFRLRLGKKKVLVVQSPDKNTVDIRQYLIGEQGYQGPTRKGIRLVSSNAIKLSDALSMFLDGDRETSNASEIPAKVSANIHTIAQPDITHLDRAFEVHGKKCYVCQTFYNRQLRNLTLYYADGNKQNSDENNMYPICGKCLAAM